MTDHEDFLRLSHGLRAMKYDFNYHKTKKLLLPHAPQAYTDGDEWREGIVDDDVPIQDGNLLTSRHHLNTSCQKGCQQGGTRDCSVCKSERLHRVVLDIDHDAALIPSSTPGHFHLIIDVNIPWHEYQRLLSRMATAGVIEQGYYQASASNGFTTIRMPWERKEQ